MELELKLNESLSPDLNMEEANTFIGKEISFNGVDGTITGFTFSDGMLIAHCSLADGKEKNVTTEVAFLNLKRAVFKDPEVQQAFEAFLLKNQVKDAASTVGYDKSETPEEHAARLAKEATEDGKKRAEETYGSPRGEQLYKWYIKTFKEKGEKSAPFILAFVNRWNELRQADVENRRGVRVAKNAEEKVEDQLEGGKAVRELATDETMKWLQLHITSLKFDLPDFRYLPANAPKSLAARLRSIYDTLKNRFPEIVDDPEHFELVVRHDEQNKSYYGYWNLNGIVRFDCTYDDFPADVKAMVEKAIQISLDRGHDWVQKPRPEAKSIANIYFCFALLDLFDDDLNFYHISTEDANKIVDENPFTQDFEDINAYGESLTEAVDTFTCCICGEESYGYGNNPEPVKHEGRCCDACNAHFVIPARLAQLNNKEEE